MSMVFSLPLCLSMSMEFFDGDFVVDRRHGNEVDDETKPSFTPAFIHLGSVHGPIVALRAQP
jgi:hypothetical protein